MLISNPVFSSQLQPTPICLLSVWLPLVLNELKLSATFNSVNSYFSFSRVRALPSENWHEIADQMFCHPHEDDVPDTCRLLSPGSGDCFVGERHLVLREEDMSWRGAVRGSRGTVTCTRCHVVLGKIRGNVMWSTLGHIYMRGNVMRSTLVHIYIYIYIYMRGNRLGNLACPRVNDDQKIYVGDQKFNSGRPHDYWTLESLFYKILFIFSIYLLTCKRNTLEDDHKCLRTTSFCIPVVL